MEAINDLTVDLGNPNQEAKMDAYDRKFAEMQKYIPFLEAMIERLQKVKDKSREAQLQKMQSLHGILSNSKRKLRIETLQRCEDVLQKLHNKVEKGNTTGLNPSHKKVGEHSSQSTSSMETQNIESSQKLHLEIMDNETPASPSPTASPEHIPKSIPIIIPMERKDELNARKCDSKPASPDQCEHIPVIAPIIIPTEREDDRRNEHSSTNKSTNNCGPDSNDLFSEWEMLEESENKMNKSRRSTWQSVIVPGIDVSTAAKLVSNNLPQKVIPEGRSRLAMAPRHIPTVPAPSLGGLRRILSAFDKNRLGGVNSSCMHSDKKSHSPVNVPEVRLKSPDRDILFPRLTITSPRQKECIVPPKSSPTPSTPLLVSPPSVLTEPPLSIEDLAELLSEDIDGMKKDRQNKDATVTEDRSKATNHITGDDLSRSKKDTVFGKQQQKTQKDSNESKVPNSFVLTQADIDRESERRWEEIDKHIVKLTTPRCLHPNKHPITPLSMRIESSKTTETRVAPSPPRISQPLLSPTLVNMDKSGDHRNHPPSPLHNIIKEKENEKEHRYADNYERHPRQARDAHDSGDDAEEKSPVSSNLSRIMDDQLTNTAYPNFRNSTDVGTKSDDGTRNVPLYQRRSKPNVSADTTPALARSEDYKRDNVDYFTRNSATKTKRPPLLPSPNIPDFRNTQWGSAASYSGNIHPPQQSGPNPYPRNPNNANFHQDMWSMGPGCGSGMPGELHQMNDTEPRNTQFNPHPLIRPLLNTTSRPQDMNRGLNTDGGFREETLGPSSVQPPMLSPPAFPASTQYRNPRMENRTYDVSYDRSSDVTQSRHTWDPSSTRVSDVGYRRDTESARGRPNINGPICRPGTPSPYVRPGTPAPLWTRDRDRNEKDWNRRGRGRERYYNDRGRSESRAPFVRESRRSEWERDGHTERDNRPRLNRDNRVLERDPRLRSEPQPQSPVAAKEIVTTVTVRDPRLIKDTSIIVDKAKDLAGSAVDRDPRRRSCETKVVGKNSPTGLHPKIKEKVKVQKSIDPKNRRDSEIDDKGSMGDKMSKDKLHSPLESLYGVIDTKAKTGQGYGLQKFKIPKIKRPDPPPPPPKVDTVNIETNIVESSSNIHEAESTTQNVKNDQENIAQCREKLDEETEIIHDSKTAMTERPISCEELNIIHDTNKSTSGILNVVSHAQDMPDKVASPNQSLSTERSVQPCEGEVSKEPDTAPQKEEVTKEWIEALIRKSFEFGQGKQLFDQAKLLETLGEALHAKKLKKIKKIIESDSESSSSKDEEIIEPKKLQVKKKRRVIFSDSSEEESLADRLGLFKNAKDDQNTNSRILEEKDKETSADIDRIESQNDNDRTSNEVPHIDKKNAENSDEVRTTSTTVVTEVTVPATRKKRAYKKRGKTLKKVEPSIEDPVDSIDSELIVSKDDLKASENKEIADKAPTKIKNKRRNSLEMLQEDIREMFISEGVVTATGHRMCRLIKEGHSNLNSAEQNFSNTSVNTSEKKLRKAEEQHTSVNSESDETSLAEQSKKDDSGSLGKGNAKGCRASQVEDSKEERIRSQKRTSKRVSKVVSRQYIESSDSGDDEPLIKSLTRSESLRSFDGSDTTVIVAQSEILQKSEISPSSEIRKSEESQEGMSLRRSKRLPRPVVDKTEVQKVDSSKVMFDSSSDESFGIDVSELAAAVDISLHPEPQSHPDPDPDTTDCLKVSRKKTRIPLTGKHKGAAKKTKPAKTIEDNADDTMFFTDDGSMLSDISMTSSITSIKKITRNSIGRNSSKNQQDTNEELLSNILIGLTAKSEPEKSVADIEKDSDADADEEFDANTGEVSEEIKKSVTKRKKKKCNWQMGILSKKKKKKKKVAPPISPIIPVSDIEFTNRSDILDQSKDISLIQADVTGSTDNDNIVERGALGSLKDIESSSTPNIIRGSSKDGNSAKPKGSYKAKLESEIEECIDIDVEVKKVSSSKKQGTKENTPHKKPVNENELGESEVSVNEMCAIAQTNTFEDLNPSEMKELLEYAWTGQERYKCLLCTFTGKNIVHHYRLNHPEDEVLVSRLMPADAKLAITESANTNIKSTNSTSGTNAKFIYNCRFCLFCAQDTKEPAKEAFYEHCTTHTGEYRFKCVSCPYQTVAKSSLKSHYYKVCRKFADNVSVAIIEDDIPAEEGIHGYMCSACNFVQLKKCNIDKHLLSKHRKNSNAQSIKINMSLDVKDRSHIDIDTINEDKDNLLKIEEVSAARKGEEMIIEKSEIKDPEDKKKILAKEEDVKQQATLLMESDVTNEKEVENSKPIEDSEKTIDTNDSAEKMNVALEQESEVAPVSGNLSVFVCPPEVAIKEHEIQLERKKKMQEIAENIGIKVNKDGTKQSIIDKLKVKMDTNSGIIHDDNITKTNLSDTVAESQNSESTPPQNACELHDRSSLQMATSESNMSENSANQMKHSSDGDNNLSLNCTEVFEDNMDKSLNNETKMKDPLATFDDACQSSESDTDTSDAEMMNSFAPYDSDSSNEQSEGQISQDVNSLLKETTTDDSAPANGLMLITIQRLAAQLQNAKTTLPSQASAGEIQMKEEKSPEVMIPKAPDVVPLSSITQLWHGQSEESNCEQSEDSIPTKTLIRIRRLSGDKLSVPSNPAELQEEKQLSSTEGSASDLGVDILQTDTEEECSFLRIENVVSLAPGADDTENENSIISDIRKAVETSPVKPRISILKKSPIILHKVGNRSVLNQRLMSSMNNSGEPIKIIPLKSVPSTSQTSKKVVAGIIPVQSTPKNQGANNIKKQHFVPALLKKSVAINPAGNTIPSKSNFKIIKFTRTSTALKHKEYVAQSVAIKLKSPEAYRMMLKPGKLCQLFKCMARDCIYTTNSLDFFKNHYDQHINVCSKEKMNRPYGWQNCAYCCTVFDDWTEMKNHLLNQHAHCQYQCSYCFYRAVAQSYVELHQAISHPGYGLAVLRGIALKDKITDDSIDRSESVRPFICQQECGKSFYIPEVFVAHLKIDHGPLISMYKCHLCAATSLKPEQLISHYKLHGIYKYQCMYCLNGSDTPWELHNHLSNFHCNLPPYIIERNVVTEASNSQDELEQLIVRNMEEDFKCTDILANIEEVPEGSWQLANNLSRNDDFTISEIFTYKSPTETLLSDKEKGGKISLLKKNVLNQFSDSNEADSNVIEKIAAQLAKQHSIDNESLSNRISIPETDDFAEYSLDLNLDMQSNKLPFGEATEHHTSQDISNTAPESDLRCEQAVINDTTVRRRGRRSRKSVLQSSFHESSFDAEAVDPLSLSGHSEGGSDPLTNDSEFDSPEPLRNLARSGRTYSLLAPSNATVKKVEHNDDSDIEILEDSMEITKKSNTPETKISHEVNADTCKTSNISSDTLVAADVPAAENDDESNANTDLNTNMEISPQGIKPFLTLDDIRHTGFTGSNLYKCGNDDCSFKSETADQLKCHLTTCPVSNDGKSLCCAHCIKRFVKVGFLLEHLKTHGLKRFGCSLCTMRCTTPYQAMSHMKTKHKYSTNKLVPANPKNPSTDGLFVVQPIRGTTEKGRGRKRTPTKIADKDVDKCSDVEKLSFTPEEVDVLPRQAIYNREVLCAVCPYSTKVRTNMVRHLQLHAKDETVPESGPVNPVPCLDKKERMFDKMVNLASSSHQNGRMGGKARESNKEDIVDENLPQFVPEHKRYVCGVAECNYLTVDDTMLRCHLKALHSDELYFRCPHCPSPQAGQETQNIGIDKMGIHLKMHDIRLYKCSHCNHHHYHRHVVERHLSDKHAEKRPFVKVIREPENTDTVQTVQDEVEDESPDRDGNNWKCNLCNYKCIYKNEMIAHASTEHDERSQYKCTECSYKTTGKINVEQHFVSRHPNVQQIKYDMVYQKIKSSVRKSGEADPGTTDEPFDTTPLWRRDMPRVRHIRGILLEEDDVAAANDSPTKGTKRKSEGGDVSNKPAKLKPGKSIASDMTKLIDEKPKVAIPKTPEVKSVVEPGSPMTERASKTRAVDKLRLLDKSENDMLNDSFDMPATDTSVSEDFSELSDSEMGQFGPYGKPNGSMYVCTLCNYFETRYKHDLRDHLYRELKYKKWHCRACGFLSVNRHTLVKHFGKQHPGEEPDHEMLTPDNSIEEWVTTLLQRQTNMIKGILNKSSPRIKSEKITSSGSVQVTTQSKKSAKEITTAVHPESTTTDDNCATVDLTGAISNLKESSFDIDMDADFDDEDSRDNNDLVIDLKDDNLEETDVPDENTISHKSQIKKDGEKTLSCKHCNMKFARWRGFKLHVQVTHLKRLGFLCPYCDRSTNSELMMRQHIHAKHPGLLEKIVHNPAAGGPELTNEFWEKEYGLICPNKNLKKRKRKGSADDLNKSKDDIDKIVNKSTDVCNLCGFTALNLTGLKAHMRMHANKSTLRCSYCSFSGAVDVDIWEHWQITHPNLAFKVEDLPTAGPSSQNSASHQQKKSSVDEYNDDIEEEQVPSATDKADKLTYCCFYCSLRSSSLVILKAHWEMVHREQKGPNEPSKLKTASPFRYREMNAPLPTPQKILKCGYCDKKGGKATLRVHMRHKHNEVPPLFLQVPETVPEGWICQWCKEFCETESKMKHHQNMFHSHLPLQFTKQGQTTKVQKGYSCPQCSFTAMYAAVMRKHVAKHVNLFKCKYCETSFPTPSLLASHNTNVHPGAELKIESTQNYESLVENLMGKVICHKPQQSIKTETVIQEPHVVASTLKRHAVAKKSTAKRPLQIQPSPTKMRCVARKSTNCLPRYPLGVQFDTAEAYAECPAQISGFSYYGIPSAPVSLSSLSTYMSVGGHQMKVNCATLGQLMKINPRVLVKDLKQDLKSL